MPRATELLSAACALFSLLDHLLHSSLSVGVNAVPVSEVMPVGITDPARIDLDTGFSPGDAISNLNGSGSVPRIASKQSLS